MSGLPKQGTPDEIEMQAASNWTLGHTILRLRNRPTGFTKGRRQAALQEAARRLVWRDAHAKHATEITPNDIINIMARHTDMNDQAAAVAEWINRGCSNL